MSLPFVKSIAFLGRSFLGWGLGGPGWLPTQGSRRPVRARLTHTVPQVTGSLGDGTPSGPVEDTRLTTLPPYPPDVTARAIVSG